MPFAHQSHLPNLQLNLHVRTVCNQIIYIFVKHHTRPGRAGHACDRARVFACTFETRPRWRIAYVRAHQLGVLRLPFAFASAHSIGNIYSSCLTGISNCVLLTYRCACVCVCAARLRCVCVCVRCVRSHRRERTTAKLHTTWPRRRGWRCCALWRGAGAHQHESRFMRVRCVCMLVYARWVRGGGGSLHWSRIIFGVCARTHTHTDICWGCGSERYRHTEIGSVLYFSVVVSPRASDRQRCPHNTMIMSGLIQLIHLNFNSYVLDVSATRNTCTWLAPARYVYYTLRRVRVGLCSFTVSQIQRLP